MIALALTVISCSERFGMSQRESTVAGEMAGMGGGCGVAGFYSFRHCRITEHGQGDLRSRKGQAVKLSHNPANAGDASTPTSVETIGVAFMGGLPGMTGSYLVVICICNSRIPLSY